MFVFSSQFRNFVYLWRNRKDSLPSEPYFIFVSLKTTRYPPDSDTDLGVTPKEDVLSAGAGAIVSIFYKCDLKHVVGRLSAVIKRTDTTALSGNISMSIFIYTTWSVILLPPGFFICSYQNMTTGNVYSRFKPWSSIQNFDPNFNISLTPIYMVCIANIEKLIYIYKSIVNQAK